MASNDQTDKLKKQLREKESEINLLKRRGLFLEENNKYLEEEKNRLLNRQKDLLKEHKQLLDKYYT